MLDAQLRSALIVSVPEAGPIVDGWREQTAYAKPSSGVPAHVTILFPFVPPANVDESVIDDLRKLFNASESFDFELRAPGRFASVFYLAPEPAHRFQRLTEAVWRRYPEYPPYCGAFDTIVPHLTVAEGDTEILDEAEEDVLRALPIAAEATGVLLLEEVEPDSARWVSRARLPLGEPAVESP
jgi:2'-5' RNA ligase